MRRFYAIILLSVHLFNLGGYALLFQYYIHQSDVQLVKQIFDNKIDSKKLIEIKVPVHSPTVQDMNEYEVVEGQIQVKSVYYDYVKLKITHDTVFFVCIPNAAKTRLVNANILTTKEINGVPLNKKTNHDPFGKKFNPLDEYNLQTFEYNHVKFETVPERHNKAVEYSLTSPFIDSPGKPPDHRC